MPRTQSSAKQAPGSKTTTCIRGELVIHYTGLRALEMKQTALADRPEQEKVQTRKFQEDLKALKIVLTGVVISRYLLAWKRGRARVLWWLEKGSTEYMQLKYLVRKAHDTMGDLLCELEIAKILWMEDSKPIPMTSLPSVPATKQWSKSQNKENVNLPLPPRPIAQSSQAIEDSDITVLPTLTVTVSNGNIQFVKATRPKDTCLWREWVPEESIPTLPNKPVAVPMHTPLQARSDEEQRKSSMLPQELPRRELSATLPITSDVKHPSQKVPNYHPLTQSVLCNTSHSPAPHSMDHSEMEHLRNILIDEMCQRKKLETALEGQKRFTNNIIAQYGTQIEAVTKTLDATQDTKDALEAQMVEAQSSIAQLQTALKGCRTDLAAMQNALKMEQEERVRVNALLDELRKEREDSTLPALATAFSMIDGLTSQALDYGS